MNKTILLINSCNFGSTGNIMLNIAETARDKGYTVYTATPDGRSMRKKKLENHIFIGSIFERNIHIQLAKLTGFNGCFSYFSTRRFLRKVERIKPEFIHLHNLHNCYINLKLLFQYIKKNNVKAVWTLHDCWAFTGHCPYFDIVKCDKWKMRCYDCPQYKEYPASCTDNAKYMYRLKKKWFTGIQNMTIVTPSQWLSDLVKQSYLKEYPVKVINNGIDLNIFKPTDCNFREEYHLENKYIVLGVAFDWGKRKGLDVFIELSKKLDERYKIVLVGTDDNVDKQLPENIISIHRTQNQIELAEIYSAADVFVNPTREENFPTVNIESIACGTPVVTFRTGGSPEILDESCGSVVPCDDIDALYYEIIRICKTKPFTEEACLKQAEKFNMKDKFQEYVALYDDITKTES